MSDTVTIVFTDLVGSTALAGRLGDDANDELRRRHFSSLSDEATATAGELVKNLGDGVMVAYASAADAVGGAIAMQRAVERDNRTGAAPLAIRIGISSGDARHEGGDWFGAPVVEAARLCADASGGQILASDVVRLLAGSRGGHTFRKLGARELKGLAEPLDVCEVEWTAQQADRLPLPPPLTGAESIPMVGRDAELSELIERVAKIEGGHRDAVFLGGEPGIGKTRLATEFAAAAYERGAMVLFGRCDEESLSPYQPFLEALGYFVRHTTADELRLAAGSHASVLARLLPDLADRLPGLPEPPSSDPDSDRYRMFEGVAALLRRLSEGQPVVLVLDDLHWADKPTLLLLRHVLRHPDSPRILVVGTYRDTELGRAHPLSESFADLRRDGFDDRVPIRGLHEDDIEALVTGVAGRDLDDSARSLVTALYDVTEGSPLFLREVLRHLVEVGVLRQSEGTWTVERLITRAGLPEGVKEVIGRRLSRLSDRTNDVLRSASVIGREFDVALLASVHGIADDAVLDALDEALEARIVSEVGGVDRFAFAHALVREALLDEISTARRIRLHQRVGSSIEALYGDDIESHLSQLAFHYSEAAGGVPPKQAIDVIRRAAARALSLYAYEEAAIHFRAALEILGNDDEPTAARRVDLLLHLGDAERRAAGGAGSAKTYEKALAEARALGDAELVARSVMGITGWYSYPGRRDPEELALLEEALGALGDEHLQLRAWLSVRLGLALHYGSYEGSRPLAELGLQLAREAGDARTLAYALWAWRWHLMISPDLELRGRNVDEMEAAARAAGDGWLVGGALAWRCADRFAAGDIGEVREAMAAYHAIMDESRLVESRYYVTLFDGALAVQSGRLDEAERLMNEAFVLGQELDDPLVMNQYAAQLYSIRLWQDRVGELQATIEAMAEAEPEIPWRATLTLVLAVSGDHDRARAELRAVAANDFAMIPRDGNWPAFVGVLGLATVEVEDAEMAALLLPLIEPWENVRITVGVLGSALSTGASLLGGLEFVLGRYDDAVRHLEAGLASDQRAESVVFESLTAWGLARADRARGADGDAEEVTRLAAHARALAEGAGLPFVIRKLDEFGL